MTHSAQQAQSKEHSTFIVNPTRPSPHHHNGFGDTPAMDGQWRSSRIVSVRTNRVLNKHQARSVNILIKPNWFMTHTECSTSTKCQVHHH